MKSTKQLLFVLMTIGMAIPFIQAQSTVWNLDNSHSSISFSVDHLVISETLGTFNDYTMNVVADKADFTDAKFDIIIQTKSVDTNDESRDKHLRSPDFFDAEKHPTIKFVGIEFQKMSDDIYMVSGEFTLNGITKAITLEAKFGGIVEDPWGGTRAGLKIWGEIDRYEYDLKYNSVLAAGGFAIGQMVRLECRIELVKAKPAKEGDTNK